jgi:cellulose synthase/poly-beta-1,6-N-acetylglucosamine synthase-like glycosyltransferase
MAAAFSNRQAFATVARAALPREIGFLADYGAPLEALACAAKIADELGVCADAALLGEGLAQEEFFYRALADRLGLAYHVGGAPLDVAVSPARAINTGLVYLPRLGAPYRAIIAPRGPALRLLIEAAERGEALSGLAVTSPRRLGALVRVERGSEIAKGAALHLERLDPALTAHGEMRPAQTAAAAAFGLGLIGLAAAAPWAERAATSTLLWLLFSAATALRSAAAVAADVAKASPPLADADLPTYTVVVAMYREAAVIPKLVAGLNALDYPRAKLDIKLVIEAGDEETLRAIVAERLPPRYDVVVAPAGEPRTKPRALNVALDVARGELLCVYDAEDEPAPDQLRRAAARFAEDRTLDALQGKLTIANWRDGWLSFMFAVEYAALFELINPGLSALDLPVALGGTTNHFRAASLRRVGGWDAWNVTEDADLGLRLARFGARVGSLDSETLEEAPNEFGNWFRQRTRWQKGWMQTMIVHTREPVRYFREMGLKRGAAGLTLIVGAVLTCLFGPFFLAETVWRGVEEAASESPVSRLADVFTYILTLMGAQSIALPALVAMRKRGLRQYGRALLLMPLYYALISAATWVALYELIVRPFHWHKTAHGRARPPKQAPRAPATLRIQADAAAPKPEAACAGSGTSAAQFAEASRLRDRQDRSQARPNQAFARSPWRRRLRAADNWGAD